MKYLFVCAFSLIGLVLFLPLTVNADVRNDHEGLRLIVETKIANRRSQLGGDGNKFLLVICRLENIGEKTLTVARGAKEVIELNPTNSSYAYRFGFELGPDDRDIVPSQQDFWPVELRPKEITELARIQINYDRGESLPGEFLIRYIVDKTVQAKFGLWAGELIQKEKVK